MEREEIIYTVASAKEDAVNVLNVVVVDISGSRRLFLFCFEGDNAESVRTTVSRRLITTEGFVSQAPRD